MPKGANVRFAFVHTVQRAGALFSTDIGLRGCLQVEPSDSDKVSIAVWECPRLGQVRPVKAGNGK